MGMPVMRGLIWPNHLWLPGYDIWPVTCINGHSTHALLTAGVGYMHNEKMCCHIFSILMTMHTILSDL